MAETTAKTAEKTFDYLGAGNAIGALINARSAEKDKRKIKIAQINANARVEASKQVSPVRAESNDSYTRQNADNKRTALIIGGLVLAAGALFLVVRA